MNIFKALSFTLILTLTSLSGFAADIKCSGTITWVMAEHSACKGGDGKKQLAFKQPSSNYWFCSESATASSLILAVKLSNKSVNVYINNDNGETCQNHPHYIKTSYIILP